MPSVHRVWWLNVLVALAAACLFLGPVDDYGALAPLHAPWWLLAIAVAVTERWPVNLEFRRSAHSFSLTDVPVTMALVFLTGPEGVAAIAAGSAVALGLRKLPPIKFVFNLAQFVLITCLGFVVIHSIAGAETGEVDRATWLGAFAATQIGGLATIALLAVVIKLADGSLTRDQLRQMFAMDAVVTATNTSFALVLSVLLVSRPDATPILLVPMAVAFFGYRQFVAERQRHEKLEFLYEANKTLSQSPEVSHALEGLLERALEAFRAEQAEVVLFGPEEVGGIRTSLGPDEDRESMVVVGQADARALRDAASDRAVELRPPFPSSLRAYLAARGLRHSMLARLTGGERTVGVLLLGNRLGIARGFTADDVSLFETLAANASAALQYDRLEQAVSELQDLQRQLHHQAFHDSLTNLANRSLFASRVAAAVEGPDAAHAAVLFIDLDDFKTVNDTLGHAAGDQLLRAVAARLQRCVREGDLVARLGGDEFAILVTRRQRIDAAGVDVAQRILDAFALPVDAGDRLLSVRVSVGVATTKHSGRGAEDLLRDADVAMYEAKDAGKARFAVFDPAMREALLRRHGLKQELERALERRELVLQYQPIVDVATERTVALEALVRWNHPTRGRIAPAEFIPLAEETGLVVPLGRFVLEEACRQAAGWSAEPGGGVPAVQVNLSAVELEDDRLTDSVAFALEASGLPPDRLVIEITETLLVEDAERGAATLAALRALGVRLALDDFGTGYSSLSYLRDLPLDVLKIARPFVENIAVSQHDAAFVRLIIELAATIGLDVVAEGVETTEQLEALRGLGCDLAQGYLFSHPVDAPGAGTRASSIRSD